MIRLFKALAGVDPTSPDAAMVREVLLDNELFDALRYVTGHPSPKTILVYSLPATSGA
jgi:hypothetical protein